MGTKKAICLLSLVFNFGIAITAGTSRYIESSSSESLESNLSETDNNCGTTDVDYTYFKSTGSCYKIHEDTKAWAAAEVTCVAEGGHLAVINSQDEVFFLMLNMPTYLQQFLIGFRMMHCSWMTVHGQNLSQSGYEIWQENEPNNKDGKENCGGLSRDGTFNDVPCYHRSAFICERKSESELLLDTVTVTDVSKNSNTEKVVDETSIGYEPSSTETSESTSSEANNNCGTTGIDYIFYKNTESCYKVHEERKAWDDAEATCVAEGGHLAVINSQEEVHFLACHFVTQPLDQLLIGFRLQQGSWLTVHGQNLNQSGYENWHENEPNNYLGKENCGAMLRDGTFNDVPCDHRSAFICEKKSESQLLLDTTTATDVTTTSTVEKSTEPRKSSERLQTQTLRVTFVVLQPYEDEFSNRDSSRYQIFSRSLVDAVIKIYEEQARMGEISGTQRASLKRIQSCTSDDFASEVTLDIVTTGYYDMDKIIQIFGDHIHMRRSLDGVAVSDSYFSANVIDTELPLSTTERPSLPVSVTPERRVQEPERTTNPTATATSTAQGFQQTEKCKIPESPLHGTVSPFRTLVYHEENRTDEYLDVTVSCLLPYRPLGDVLLSCHKGEWNGTVAECKLFCKVYSHPSVTYYCQNTTSGEEHKCDEFVLGGTVVRPQCNENYQHYGELPPMNCINCDWDYLATCEPTSTPFDTAEDEVEYYGKGNNITFTINDSIFVKVSGSKYNVAVSNVSQPLFTFNVPFKNPETTEDQGIYASGDETVLNSVQKLRKSIPKTHGRRKSSAVHGKFVVPHFIRV